MVLQCNYPYIHIHTYTQCAMNDNNLLLPHYVITPDSFNDTMSKSRKIRFEDNDLVRGSVSPYTRMSTRAPMCLVNDLFLVWIRYNTKKHEIIL